MAQSQNSTVEYTGVASSYNGLPTHGHVMLGNAAFEYYNERNPEDCIQIPWGEIDHVAAEVLPGKKIARFAIFTKQSGHFTFATTDNKACLRAMRGHVPDSLLQRSPSLLDVAKAGVKGIFRRG